MKVRGIDLVGGALVLLLLSVAIVQAAPNGAQSIVIGKKERINDSQMGSAISALAGNVTALDLTGTSVTRYWQGYFGNITGTLVLGDANNNSLYSWAVAEPLGEIYATRVQSINWINSISCANETVVANEDNVFLTANTSVDMDSVNRTFNKITHPTFFVGGNPAAMANCNSTSVANFGAGTVFWEVLLMHNTTATPIYTSIIDPADTAGFDGSTHDFQMMVPENGRGAEEFPNGNPTTYYFFVELG